MLEVIKKNITHDWYDYFKVRIYFIKDFQDQKNTDRWQYNEYSNNLLEYFIPYILDNFKQQYSECENYKFVICYLNQVNTTYGIDIFEINRLLYIKLPNNKEYDDFLLLLLYSYLKNILKSKNIYIYSFDEYKWWNDKRQNNDNYANYKLEYKG